MLKPLERMGEKDQDSVQAQHFQKNQENTNAHTHLEVKACHDGEPLHRQLLGGLLVTMATTAFDFGTAPQVLGSCESAAQVCMTREFSCSSDKTKLSECDGVIGRSEITTKDMLERAHGYRHTVL